MPGMLLAAIVLAVFTVTGSPVFAAVDPGALCKEAKAKAAGKKAFDLMKAFGRNIKKPDVAKFDSNVSKAQSKFTKGFAKAEVKGGCDTSDDSDAIEAKVDAFVEDLVADFNKWRVYSPNGLLEVEVAMLNLAGTADFPDSLNPYYRLERGGVTLLDWSPLGIRTSDGELIDGLTFVERTDAVIDESYVMKTGKRSVRTVEANEATLAFHHTSGAEIHIIIRVADDGMAYRYRLLGEGQVPMLGEASGFHLFAGTEGWMQPYWKPTLFTPSHEWSFYRKVAAGEIIEEGGCEACPPDPEAPITITISSEVTSVAPALADLISPGDPFDSLYFVDEAQPNEATPPDFLATDPGAIHATLVFEVDGGIDTITVDSATGTWELQGEIFLEIFAAWLPIQVEIVSPLNTGLVPDLTAATSGVGTVDLTGVGLGLLVFEVTGVSVAPGGHPVGGGSLNGWGYGALFEAPGDETYLLFAEADLDRNYAGTHLGDPVGTLYRIAYPDPDDGQGVGAAEPTVTLPWTSPWRVVVAGTLADIVGSTLVEDLSAPQDAGFGADPSWVVPGRSAWSWWSQGTGTPALQMEYIDFAEEMGWEYVLVDANWNLFPDPDSTIPALADYAAARGVGIWLWYNSGGAHNAVTEQPRDLMDEAAVRQAEMEKIAGWGVKGVKVDFFQSDKQERIAQYLGILEDARDQELLVNFHGATLPRGWQRTYPNLMSMEAVRGAEWYQFDSGPDGIDNVRAVCTRNVLGSMDYTPVTFSAAFEQQGISYAHQLALSVVFESGVQHFADRADSDVTEGYRAVFAAAPVVKTFLQGVPTVWDDTLLVEGDPDSHVVVARKKGEEWYLGMVSGLEQPLSLSIPLGFLGSGSYTATIIGSGATATEWSSSTSTHTAQDSLAVDLLAKDGLVARFVPTP